MKMKIFSLDFSTVALRFYLMMGVVIGAFFIGLPWLSILALPIFFATMVGAKVTFSRTAAAKKVIQPQMKEAARRKTKRIPHPVDQ